MNKKYEDYLEKFECSLNMNIFETIKLFEANIEKSQFNDPVNNLYYYALKYCKYRVSVYLYYLKFFIRKHISFQYIKYYYDNISKNIDFSKIDFSIDYITNNHFNNTEFIHGIWTGKYFIDQKDIDGLVKYIISSDNSGYDRKGHIINMIWHDYKIDCYEKYNPEVYKELYDMELDKSFFTVDNLTDLNKMEEEIERFEKYFSNNNSEIKIDVVKSEEII